MNVQAVKPEIEAGNLLADAQFIDAYRVAIEDPVFDARLAAETMLGSSPGWINGLMAVRNLAVAPFGLKTPAWEKTDASDRIGIFPVMSEGPDRLVVGLDDKHLDFRVVVDI